MMRDLKKRERGRRSATTAGRADSTVQMAVRIPRSLRLALKAAALQQERHGKQPHTQAEIVEEAVRSWLQSHGFDA